MNDMFKGHFSIDNKNRRTIIGLVLSKKFLYITRTKQFRLISSVSYVRKIDHLHWMNWIFLLFYNTILFKYLNLYFLFVYFVAESWLEFAICLLTFHNLTSSFKIVALILFAYFLKLKIDKVCKFSKSPSPYFSVLKMWK